ncbi:hypothetical protein GJ496_000969 [Pomphorhynchus laevis]|nr:hypothetical protein GJ496_000969 [Pomphorhynchus laevis]
MTKLYTLSNGDVEKSFTQLPVKRSTKHRRRERIQPHKSSSAPTKPKSCFPVTQDSHQQ